MTTEVTPDGGAPAATESNVQSPAAVDFTKYDTILSGLDSSVKEAREDAKASKEQIEMLRQAFAPQAAPSDDQMDDSELAHFMQEFTRAEQEGRPMPITAKLAAKLIETRKNNRSELQLLKEKIQKLEATSKVISEPEYQTEVAALYKISDIMVDTLKGIYGHLDPHLEHSVSSKIREEINRLKKEAPQNWEEIRKSDRLKKAMVEHFVDKVIPPKAKELMSKEQAKNRPTTEKDLVKALEEANKIQDPKEREKQRRFVRARIWEYKISRVGKRA